MLLIEPRRMRDRAADILAEEADLATHLARTTWDVPDGVDIPHLHLPFDRLLAPHRRAGLDGDGHARRPRRHHRAVDRAGTPRSATAPRSSASSRKLIADGYRVVVAADTEASAGRIGELLRGHGLELDVVVGPLERGCILPGVKLAVLAEPDLTGRRRAHRAPRPRRTDAAAFFDDLKPGDYVVHHQHGVARYGGMVTRAIGGVERDYLLLEYRGDDKLYVPSDQIDAVRHYTGGDAPSLSQLGRRRLAEDQGPGAGRGAAHRAGARRALPEAAAHARATRSPRTRRGSASWRTRFPYRETPDQLKAIVDVKADMEAPVPMDRLVCGDVGFGKTEVAIRAAFKAVQDGKQVAVLVPTTLLAQQHLQTFSDRFAGVPGAGRGAVPLPHRRRRPGGWPRACACGEVDCVIGTHRLLSDDMQFKDLGLLVVDEEQRFGVSHKEQIKQLRSNVDVLTLTATPIPRTLEMSLTGIRDLTLLNTPPAERQPILTYVGEDDERAVAEAIRRELLREGQVVLRAQPRARHRGRGRPACASSCPRRGSRWPTARWTRAASSRSCSTSGRASYDVLVCTTIIESGIDMPTVNTLVVDRADLLGLGQLHQLRGRVGPGRAAGLRLPLPPAGAGAHRGGLRAAEDHRRGHRARVRASGSPCATSRSAAPAPCSAPASPATSPRSATTSTARW